MLKNRVSWHGHVDHVGYQQIFAAKMERIAGKMRFTIKNGGLPVKNGGLIFVCNSCNTCVQLETMATLATMIRKRSLSNILQQGQGWQLGLKWTSGRVV